MVNLKRKLPVIAVLVLTLPAIFPLFHQGFFTMHDDQQVIRLFELDHALSTGQFPVRWVTHLGFGYGYPLFNFYPPLVYYLGEIFHLLFRLSFIASTKLVFATAFFGAALTMYFLVKHHFGKLSGIAASLFYTYAPYHALDAYVRGALAELFSFVWLPLILLSIDKLATNFKDKKWGLVLSLSYAALMLTHNLILLPFTLIIGLYILLKLPLMKTIKHKTQFIVHCSLFIVLSLAMSAFFWLPALLEKQFTLVDSILLAEKYTFSLHYVYPRQLWNSLWGFAGSAPGILDGFSFKIGKLHVVLSILVSAASLLILLTKKSKKLLDKSLLLTTCSLLLLLSAFMTTSYSSFIWTNFQPLQYLQFPWRFLTFTALFSSILAGASVYFVEKISDNKLLTTSYLLLATAALLLPNLKLFQPQHYLDVDDSHYTSDEFAKWQISKTSFEFVPKGVETRIGQELGVTELAIDRDQISSGPYSIMEGNPEIKLERSYAHLKQLTVKSDTPSTIQINTFNFPGWYATLDGQPLTIDDNNPLKLITLSIPPGQHTITAKFTNTPARFLSNAISLVAIIFLIILAKQNLINSILKR